MLKLYNFVTLVIFVIVICVAIVLGFFELAFRWFMGWDEPMLFDEDADSKTIAV